jgi:uncharacterized membrane protein required for colicin V production
VFDIGIAILIAVAAIAGWRKGFIAPLFAVGLSLLGLYALYNGPAAGSLPTGTTGIGLGVVVIGFAASIIGRVGAMLVGLVHRISILKAADRTLGVPLGAVTGLVAVYAALTAVVSFDNLLAPFHGKASVDQAAVAAMKAALQANPQFSVMLDQGTLDTMATQVVKQAIPADQLATYDQTLSFYEGTVRPELVSSRLAPVILGVGEHLPFLGRHVDFPAK